MPTDLVRVVIADDHEAALSALTRILSHEFNLVGTAKNGKEAVDATTLLKPDVVILDIQMPIMNGFEAARTILSLDSATRNVFITAVADSDYVRAALSLGASGFVLKSRAVLDLPHAIRLAMLGQSFVSPI
ncbi:MAG: response regulator transcription factor [Bryobacteraceae bacterium]